MKVQKLVALGEAEMAVKLVEEANGLGLGFAGTGSLRRVVVSLSTEGKLAHVTRWPPPPPTIFANYVPARLASSSTSLSHFSLSLFCSGVSLPARLSLLP